MGNMKGLLRRKGASALNFFLLLTILMLVVFYRRTFFQDIEVLATGPVNSLHDCSKPDFDFGKVCIVVRTFRGHAPSTTDPFTSASALIPSFLSFKYRNWVSLFIDTDADRSPYLDIASVLGRYGDDRLIALNATIVADGMSVRYDTIDSAYNITDKAIRFCPSDSRWLVVTQGDNGAQNNLYFMLSAV